MSKLRIAIDGNEANILNRVGSNVYAFEIITHLEKLLRKRDEVEITVLLAQDKIEDLPSPRRNWQYKIVTPKKFWTQWALPVHLFINQDNYDLFFTPGHYAPRLSPVSYISSVMDTAFLEYPEQFKKSDTIKLTSWTKYSVKQAKKVITISQFTKQQVAKNYAKDPDDIIVAYPSIAINKQKITQTNVETFFKRHKIKEPYFLFVGTLQPRKNLETLIEAFEVYSRMRAGRNLKKKKYRNRSKNKKKPQLVLAGKVGWLAEPILERIKHSTLRKKIITTGFVSDLEKQILYRHATATCLVGLYEGFGIPPLESLYFNTPVIVSNITSLPEVVGEAGLLVNPHNPQEIADKMWQAENMSVAQKRQFKKNAREQIKKFSWQKSAEIILTALLTQAQKNKNENKK